MTTGQRSLDLWEFASRMAKDVVRADAQKQAATACSRLSPRQLEVLQLASKGLTSRQIAEHLKMGKGTVEDHKKAVFRKLDVGSMAEAAVIAAKAGLV